MLLYIVTCGAYPSASTRIFPGARGLITARTSAGSVPVLLSTSWLLLAAIFMEPTSIILIMAPDLAPRRAKRLGMI